MGTHTSAADQEPLFPKRQESERLYKAATGAWCAKVAEGVACGVTRVCVCDIHVCTPACIATRPALHTVGLPPTKRKPEALHCKLRKARVHG